MRIQHCVQQAIIVVLLLTCEIGTIRAQQQHKPCGGDDYGNSAARMAIEQAMLQGTSGTVAAAINMAKSARGTSNGCPSQSYIYNPPDFTEVQITEVAKSWQTIHSPTIATFRFMCPSIGREWAPVALGSYYARLAGATFDSVALKNIAKMYEAQQYRIENVGDKEKMKLSPGVFGYAKFVNKDSCARTALVGETTEYICKQFPDLCVSYKSGLYPGQQFVIGDVKSEESWLDGGLAFDHAWIGAMMIESAFMQPEASFRDFCRRSAVMAGDWAVEEPPVRNHNYTAKLVWLLAQLTDWTGDRRFREALEDKLVRNLLPGVLMDDNKDGFVDGVSYKLPFSKLSPVAQRPGRMWDGHNALPGYHAMNAWAMVDAYCALRDRDGSLADSAALVLRAKVKRYAVAMLDNLAWEINTLGVMPHNIPGFNAVPFAFLTGLWKIAAYEREQHRNWDSAAAALWNTGYAKHFGANTVNVGLQLAYKSGVRYAPFSRRTIASGLAARKQAITLEQNSPNPFADHTVIRFKIVIPAAVNLRVFDALGREVLVLLKNEWFPSGEHYLNLSASSLQNGTYIYRLEVGEFQELRSMQVIKIR